LLDHSFWRVTMHTIDQPVQPSAIRTDLGAIFVSLELSQSTWLITSLSAGNGEKMSKHSVSAGSHTELFARFAQLQERSRMRTGHSHPIICHPGGRARWFLAPSHTGAGRDREPCG
jgi:hypothetical protein